MESILLLNATYEPLAVLSLRRAAKLLLKERVEPVVADRALLVGSSETLAVPTVLRLKVYINVPRRHTPSWTRWGMFARDHFACAYCGRRLSRKELTVDHVLPTSRGGRSTWGNTVTACRACNHRKADRTPHEARMKLLIEPRPPRTSYLVIKGQVPATWKIWVEF